MHAEMNCRSLQDPQFFHGTASPLIDCECFPIAILEMHATLVTIEATTNGLLSLWSYYFMSVDGKDGCIATKLSTLIIFTGTNTSLKKFQIQTIK